MNSRVFTESCVFFQWFFRLLKLFVHLTPSFDSIVKKYRSFATVHYSLVATNAVFAGLQQFKAICQGNRQTDTHTHTH